MRSFVNVKILDGFVYNKRLLAVYVQDVVKIGKLIISEKKSGKT